MLVTVDKDRCCGAGQCVLSAPDIFDQDEETGIVVLLEAQPALDRLADVRTAIDVCPAQAISLTEDAEQ